MRIEHNAGSTRIRDRNIIKGQRAAPWIGACADNDGHIVELAGTGGGSRGSVPATGDGQVGATDVAQIKVVKVNG